ncbi:hypothetical protein LTR66_015092 [Elasticomyces elasticus]|nr:hypothetical protein LTR66_015092 [Elasticomyces elasticus]
MYFSRRKSGIYHEDIYAEDNEPQRRNRLSKPLTNGSPTNGSVASQPQMMKRKSLASVSRDNVISPVHHESREAMRDHLFSWDENARSQQIAPKQSAVALMRSRFEDMSDDPAQPIHTIPRRPLSNLLGRKDVLNKPSISTMDSNERLAPPTREDGSISISPESSSNEAIVVDHFPPARKTASFIPGAATRRPSRHQPLEAQPQAQNLDGGTLTKRADIRDVDTTIPQHDVRLHVQGLSVATPHLQCAEPHCEAPTDYNHIQVEDESDWKPPTPLHRPETPADLEQTHLGNLRLGSLRVTNHDRYSMATADGRSSPALTDVSRQLGNLRNQTSTKVRRDVSSVYPESELMSEIGTVRSTGSDRLNELTAAHEAGKRDFSFTRGTEARYSLDAKQQLEVAQAINDVLTRDEQRQKRMVSMDREERVEMRKASLKKEKAREAEREKVRTRTRADSTTLMAYDYMSELALSPFDQESLKSPMGSVLRRRSLRQAPEEATVTEAKPLPEAELPTSKIRHNGDFHNATAHLEPIDVPRLFPAARQDSPASFLSNPARTSHEEQFSSALEFQSPGSPVRPEVQTQFPERLLPPNAMSNAASSDSGYSSNTSLTTIRAPQGFKATPYEHYRESPDQKSPTTRNSRFPFRKGADKSAKPVLIKPTLSRIVPPASFAQVESPSAATSTRSLASPSPVERTRNSPSSLPNSPTKTSEGLQEA